MDNLQKLECKGELGERLSEASLQIARGICHHGRREDEVKLREVANGVAWVLLESLKTTGRFTMEDIR